MGQLANDGAFGAVAGGSPIERQREERYA
jgi:hypothetical protein